MVLASVATIRGAYRWSRFQRSKEAVRARSSRLPPSELRVSGGTKWFPRDTSDASVIAYLFRTRVEAKPNKLWRAISENCLLQTQLKTLCQTASCKRGTE